MEFQGALKVLEEELQPEADLLNPDGSYLISVAQGLLYKVNFFHNPYSTTYKFQFSLVCFEHIG